MAVVIVALTEEQSESWRALSARMLIRQELSDRFGPGVVIQVIEIDAIPVPLDRWTVPACSASGAW